MLLFLRLELAALVFLTPLFLFFAPHESALYLTMALVFLGYISAGAKITRHKIWGLAPGSRAARWKRSVVSLATPTLLVTGLFFAWCLWKEQDISYLNLFLAGGLYFFWALIQQTIFQFYLLGRLLAVAPTVPAGSLITANGCAYGLVHLPDIWLTLVTMLAGIVWSNVYYRDRLLVPIAVSHAMLGASYYYFVIGTDMVQKIADNL
jgi:hypothetical protein